MRRAVCAAFLLPLLWPVACRSDGGPPVAVAERDSAGVHIVEIPADAGVPAETLEVGAVPGASFGAVDGPPETVLYRVVGAFRLADGRIAVGNGGTHEIRYYRTDGSFDMAVGREGDGPGEFRSLSWIGSAGGDSVAAFDSRLDRMTVFTPDGLVARTFRLPEFPASNWEIPIPRWARVHGRLTTGEFVIGAYPGATTGVDFEGVQEDSVLYYFLGPEGEPAGATVAAPADQDWVQASENRVTTLGVPFGRVAWAAPGPTRLWLAATDAPDLRAYDADGEVRTILRRDAASVPVRPSDVERYRARMIEDADPYPEWQEELRKLWPQLPLGTHLPRFSTLAVDELGRPWVQEYVPGDDNPPWTVYDAEGRPFAAVRLPPGLRILAISRDEVIGLRIDDLSVEHLEVYSLSRGRG